jgi:DNA-binding CsgD family transcriptional regulator
MRQREMRVDGLIISQVEGLSARQKEILRLIAQYKRAKEIARDLNITERTVKAHTLEARKRLNVSSSRDAALLLLEYEREYSPVPEGQWPSRTIPLPPETVPPSGHEHRPKPTKEPSDIAGRLHDLSVDGITDSMGSHGGSLPSGGRGGHDRSDPGGISQPSGARDHAAAFVRHGLVDGFADFSGRLKALSLPGWIGMIMTLVVISALIVGGLLYLSLGILEGMQEIFRRAI